MKTSRLKVKPIVAVLSVLAFAAVIAISPHAFAQQPFQGGQGQQNGIPLGAPYGQPNTPGYVDPNAVYGWSSGLAVAAVLSGVGIWTAVRSK